MGQTYSSKEIIKLIQKDGWRLRDIKGDHYHFIHDKKAGITTVPPPSKRPAKRDSKFNFKTGGAEISSAIKGAIKV